MSVNDMPSPVRALYSRGPATRSHRMFPPAPRSPRHVHRRQWEEAGSLDPYCVSSLGSPGFHCQLPKRGEKLLHFFLKHVISFLGIFFCSLGVSHFDFYHCELLPFLIQFIMEAHHLCFQSQVSLL